MSEYDKELQSGTEEYEEATKPLKKRSDNDEEGEPDEEETVRDE